MPARSEGATESVSSSTDRDGHSCLASETGPILQKRLALWSHVARSVPWILSPHVPWPSSANSRDKLSLPEFGKIIGMRLTPVPGHETIGGFSIDRVEEIFTSKLGSPQLNHRSQEVLLSHFGATVFFEV